MPRDLDRRLAAAHQPLQLLVRSRGALHPHEFGSRRIEAGGAAG
jgi:hypothetical protein